MLQPRESRVGFVAPALASLLAFGCGGSSPTQPAARPCETTSLALERGRSQGRLDSSGACREYLVNVPESYDPERPAPLVIAMHGHGGNPAEFEVSSGLSNSSEREGFIVAYPAGLGGGWQAFARSDDVRFLRDLVAHLHERANVDRQRVYVTGFSGGGGMAHRAACEAADLFAAAAPVSAALSDYRNCAPARPMPILTVHGDADRMVLPGGGNGGWPAVGEWTRFWAGLDRCLATPTITDRGMITETAWRHCAGGSEVRLLMVQGLEHRWWGAVNVDLWEFFAAHPLSS